ncbi:MAG: SPFH domain-containing protein [Planctomycetota bacterium]|jgi:regulator of protease activity HflC (stomatin/prohibitin superfamily)
MGELRRERDGVSMGAEGPSGPASAPFEEESRRPRSGARRRSGRVPAPEEGRPWGSRFGPVPPWAKRLVAFAAVTGFVAAVLLSSFRFKKVEGSERVVWQTLSGVQDTIGEDGLHVYFGWTTTANVYYIGSDTFIIDDKTVLPQNSYMDTDELEFNQPDVQPVEIPVMMEKLSLEDMESGKTTGPTPVILRCVMQFHLDPGKLVQLHKEKTNAFRRTFMTFMKDVLLQNIIDNTTILDARTVYQGAGRVQLQGTIEKSLRSESRFESYGIVVEKFVIREITLKDPKFLSMITAEAQAEQRRKTAEKEQAAAEAEALKAEAEAKAEQNRRLVEAETKKGEEIAKAEAEKQKQILDAEAKAEQVKLAAEARKEQDRLEGEGLKLRKVAEAEGVLELGKAEAEAKKLKLLAYEGEGGQRFAQVEIAAALGEGIQKVYYIPESMNITALAEDFQRAIAIGLPEVQPKARPDERRAGR